RVPVHRGRRPRGFQAGCLTCGLSLGILLVMSSVMCFSGLAFYTISPPATTNILILGVDARPNEPLSEASRTDSIMVLSVNAQRGFVSLMSLPRDVFIQSPTFGSLRANTVVRNGELNEAGSGIDEMIASM